MSPDDTMHRELDRNQPIVLIVDDVLDNIAVLHDALDESGYTVLIASNGQAALIAASEAQPDIILLDAVMPGMNGFEVCRRLKQGLATRHIPVIFMTGLTESEHIVAGFDAGGADYVTKPVRPPEVLARISSHLRTSRLMHQTQGALDAFGQAAIAIMPDMGRIIWQTPLAKRLMQQYCQKEDDSVPAALMEWVQNILEQDPAAPQTPFTIFRESGRLMFTLVEVDHDNQWIILLNEHSDAAQIEALMHTFSLTRRESEVLYWTMQGKTNKDIGDILGSSPRTVNKHLEHVFTKLNVETRTAASALVRSRIHKFRV